MWIFGHFPIPLPSVTWRKPFYDLRDWYYVTIYGKRMGWWACEDEIEELKHEYGEGLILEKIPRYKTILKL